MEANRVRRKRKGSSASAHQHSEATSSQSTQAGSLTSPLQSAPPAIRLKHSDAHAQVAHDSAGKESIGTRGASGTESSDAPQLIQDVLSSPGKPLDSETRARLESGTGKDFSGVRLHTDEQAAASAQALEARAYSVGPHIVFGEGEYNPHTPEGQRLLAHEAAHVAHRAEAGASSAGVAPPDSLAERRADEFATSLVNSSREPVSRSAPFSFRDWGESWYVHRQPTIVTRGTVQHTGHLGPAAAPTGTIEVRSGEDLEEGGVSLPNRIALEYSGAQPTVSKWLQFIWLEMIATTPTGNVRSSGSVSATGGNKSFTTDPRHPSWSVDSASASDPFYEAGGRNIRVATGTTIFDAPGGASGTSFADAAYNANPTATSVTLVMHFDTYLIQNNRATYHVTWTGTTTYTRSGGTTTASAIVYSVGSSGPVRGLPTNLRTILRSSYSTYPGVRRIR